MSLRIVKYGLISLKTIVRMAVVLPVVVFFSCSSVKYVPEGKYLLNNVKMKIDNKEVDKDVAKTYIRQKDNFRIFGFLKFHLFLYNLSSEKKTEGLLKRIGEPPQIYDELMVKKSTDQLKKYLINQGFYRANVVSTEHVMPDKQKVNVTYKIETGERYLIHAIEYRFINSKIQDVFENDTRIEKLRLNTAFNTEVLDKYRSDLADIYRNNGYYYFTKEEIKYVADTNKVEKRVGIKIFVGLNKSNVQDSLKIFSQYRVSNFTIDMTPIALGNQDLNRERIINYSAISNNIVIDQNAINNYRKSVIVNSIKIDTNSVFRQKDVTNTYKSFNRLQQFRFVDIQFQETVSPEDTNNIECLIRLAPLNKQSSGFEIEGTNTSGNMGIAGNVNFVNRNIFKGAEIFKIKFRGGIERQQNFSESNGIFNTQELGIETDLRLPNLLGPGHFIGSLRNLQANSNVTLSYNYQKRPEYQRTIANLRLGYNWVNKKEINQNWNLIDFNIVNIINTDKKFIERIKDEYIKSSFTDHLILSMNYSLTYNTQRNLKFKDYRYLRFNIESAGNLLDMACRALGKTKISVYDEVTKTNSEFYRVLNTRFAQYLKTDFEYRYGHYLDKYNSIVTRFFLGVGVPYRNFDVLPFEKRYFTGGANGIRAWQVRSLGPGAYTGSDQFYPNKSSDIKLEANLEYRFNLMKYLEGALFVDAGNIWAINKKDNRPNAVFYWDKFIRQIAIGTGTGLRFDFTYFVFRLDLGMKLHDPAQQQYNGWIIGNRKLTSKDFALSFAIGYPF